MRKIISSIYLAFIRWGIYRKYAYKCIVRLLVKHMNGEIGDKKIMRIFALWENDGRFIWLKRAAKQCEVYFIPRVLFDLLFNDLLKDYVADKMGQGIGEVVLDKYYQERYKRARSSFRDYTLAILSFISEYYQVDAWLLPKMNDDWIVDLIMMLKVIGKPIIVNDRESQITPQRMLTYPPILIQHIKEFEPDLSVVNNETHREFFIRSGHNPKTIILTGKPDTDYWYHPEFWKSKKELGLSENRVILLFFAFGAKAYLNFYYGHEKRTWQDIVVGYHEALARTVKKYHNKIQVIYKVSLKEFRDRNSLSNTFCKYAEGKDKDCIIRIGGDVSSLDLVRLSNAVLGFQTSGLTEAMFTDNQIIYGAWGEFYEDIKDTLLPYDKTDALTYVRTQKQLEECLVRVINRGYKITDKERKSRRLFREQYFYKPDGNASHRVLDNIVKVVRENDR